MARSLQRRALVEYLRYPTVFAEPDPPSPRHRLLRSYAWYSKLPQLTDHLPRSRWVGSTCPRMYRPRWLVYVRRYGGEKDNDIQHSAIAAFATE